VRKKFVMRGNIQNKKKGKKGGRDIEGGRGGEGARWNGDLIII